MAARQILSKSFLFLIFLLIPSFLFSQEMVSVLDFKAEGGISEYEAGTLRNLFETELIGSGKYAVIEKAQQDQVVGAQKDSLHGCVDDACAVEIGKLLSADRILLGNAARIGDMRILTVKMIDIRTGRSEKAESIRANSIEGLIENMSSLVGLLTGGGASGGRGRIVYEDEPSSGVTAGNSGSHTGRGRAYVVIKSNPPGSAFTLKNREGQILREGRTPQSLPLEQATYILEARDSEGLYVPFSENLVVNRSGRMTYNIELQPDFGSLSITSTPPGMQVLSAGIPIGTTPYRNSRFKSGGYSLVVKDPDGLYLSTTIDFRIESGGNISRSIRLDPNFVEVSIRETEGIAGKVYVNDDYKGRLPFTGKLPFSDTDLRIVADDSRFYPYEESISPRRAGETISRSFHFSGKMGFLIVESEPFAEGDLYVDGEKIDVFPNMVELFTGRHEVEIRTEIDGEEMVGKGKAVITEGGEAVLTLVLEDASPPVPDDFVFIEGGTFRMGSNDGDADEKPIHSVTVSDFYIGKYEVTQGVYEDIMGTSPSNSGKGVGSNYPVNQVSWYDAVNFCNKLSQKEGYEPVYHISGINVTCDWSKNGYRLPTEAEWEYAARGGKENRGYTYSGSSTIGSVAWYDSNSGNKTHPVGGKRANELGIYDMSGNVWEWCWDKYGDYSSRSQTDPLGVSSGSFRVLRGGSWNDDASYCRSAKRYDSNPSGIYCSHCLGFRLVLATGQD